ncbi:hypothetical protein SAMN02949497_3195 [Methylomagnum ishizawai]|uniref:Uncharacterized protein n=1 Tax=Methylomagnum ishizawai TaxID=1760988 RepID=A0A1Y6D043_9GAMM|nr:hypothetical protein SAMN02949497_3195 [Methylomagnum ishizawai]
MLIRIPSAIPGGIVRAKIWMLCKKGLSVGKMFPGEEGDVSKILDVPWRLAYRRISTMIAGEIRVLCTRFEGW